MVPHLEQSSIRNTHFRPRQSGIGIELLTIEALVRRFAADKLQKVERLHFYLILLYTHGSGRHWIDFVPHNYNDLTMQFISNGQVQQFEVNLAAQGYLLLFTPEFLYENSTTLNVIHSLQIFDHALHQPSILLSAYQHADFVGRFMEIGHESEQPADMVKNEILRHLLRIVLLRAERSYRATPSSQTIAPHYEDFITLRKLVQEHLAEEHTVDFYARKLSMSVRQVNRLTRQVVGKTVKAYLEEQLVLEMKRLLAQGQMPIKEIAYRVGFSEPTNMVKFFKKHTKVSPSAFRQRYFSKHQPAHFNQQSADFDL